MFRGALAFLVVALGALRAEAQAIEGNWKISYVVGGTIETTTAIVKMKINGDKVTGELVATPRKGVTLKSIDVDKGTLRVVLQTGLNEFVFEGPAPNKAGEEVLGAACFNNAGHPAKLTGTDEDTIDAKATARTIPCPPLEEAKSLAAKANNLAIRARFEKDADKKVDLQKQADEADRTMKKEMPRLLREVIAKHADGPAVFEAIIVLMQSAKANGVTADELKTWAQLAIDKGKIYGTRFQGELATQFAGILLMQPGSAGLALEYARHAEKALSEKTPLNDQARLLNLFSRVARKAGKADDAKAFDQRAAKVDSILDKEYSTTMPGFKGEAFTGRKGKSDRAVFMELFTGAMCPPCVAADLAFDVLQSTYKPSELVLIQYHMHIPGPDPMTNDDTQARWKYYGSAVRGVPSVFFDGKFADVKGGGPAANAQKKYQQYRDLIDPALETDAGCKLTLKAHRNGDKIDIHASVSNLAKPGANTKLRILIAEETVRYRGSNGVRLHHNVVRAFPGGVEGLALNEASVKQNASIGVNDLRDRLDKYLDDFLLSGKSFFNPIRPMSLEHLRVIAFVQDDSTKEVLQAAMVNVEGR